MAVVVRLRRMGTNKKPFFRVVVADERCSNKGKVLETLGWYNPRQDGTNFELNLERVDYWRGVGARTTNTVDSILRKARKTSKSAPDVAPAAGVDQELKVKKIADLPQEVSEKEEAPASEVKETEEVEATVTEVTAETEQAEAVEPTDEVKKEASE